MLALSHLNRLALVTVMCGPLEKTDAFPEFREDTSIFGLIVGKLGRVAGRGGLGKDRVRRSPPPGTT